MLAALRAAYTRHRAFVLLFILFVAFRAAAVVLLHLDVSDRDYYFAWGQLGAMGYQTFEDLWSTYPPLFATLMLPAFELASRIPPWIEPRLFFDIVFGLWLLLFECGNLILIYRLGGRLDREKDELETRNQKTETRNQKLETRNQKLETGERSSIAGGHNPHSAIRNPQFALPPGLAAAALYALFFTPFYTLLGWFEGMPLFFLLLGLELLLVGRAAGWVGSAVAVALGTLVKLTPVLLVPVAIRWLGARLSWRAMRNEWFNRRSAGNLLRPALYTLIFLGVTGGLGLWLARGNTELALSSLRVNAMRPPWQSVWALIDGYYGFGLVPADIRNFVALETLRWESDVPWPWVTLAFVALYLWLYTRAYDWHDIRTPIAFTGISIIWLFLYSKGWSPQFLVWILAFVVLLTPTLFGVAIAIALELINLGEAFFFLILLPDERWLLTATVTLRTLLLILLAATFLGQIWPAPRAAHRLRRVSQGLAWGVMLAAVIGAVIATPRAAQAYQERRLVEHPCRSAVEFLQQESGGPIDTILTEEIAIWQDLYPWLRQAYDLRVIDSYSAVDEAPGAVIARTLDTLLVDGQAVWWVEGEGPSLAQEGYFPQSNVQLLAVTQHGACRVAALVRLPDHPPEAAAAAEGGAIYLLHADVRPTPAGDAVDVTLYWQADEPIDASYTVFTQLFDASGTMVAQQDNLPVKGLAPTNTWTPGQVVRDPYRLALPAQNDAEPYQLHVGLYNEDGRLPLTLTDGARSDHVVLPITPALLGP